MRRKLQSGATCCELVLVSILIQKLLEHKSSNTTEIYCHAIDYVSGGKFYVRSKTTYESSCKWESEIVEITIPDYNLKPGHKIITAVPETATVDNLVKIKVHEKGELKENIFVLEKVE